MPCNRKAFNHWMPCSVFRALDDIAFYGSHAMLGMIAMDYIGGITCKASYENGWMYIAFHGIDGIPKLIALHALNNMSLNGLHAMVWTT